MEERGGGVEEREGEEGISLEDGGGTHRFHSSLPHMLHTAISWCSGFSLPLQAAAQEAASTTSLVGQRTPMQSADP